MFTRPTRNFRLLPQYGADFLRHLITEFEALGTERQNCLDSEVRRAVNDIRNRLDSCTPKICWHDVYTVDLALTALRSRDELKYAIWDRRQRYQNVSTCNEYLGYDQVKTDISDANTTEEALREDLKHLLGLLYWYYGSRAAREQVRGSLGLCVARWTVVGLLIAFGAVAGNPAYNKSVPRVQQETVNPGTPIWRNDQRPVADPHFIRVTQEITSTPRASGEGNAIGKTKPKTAAESCCCSPENRDKNNPPVIGNVGEQHGSDKGSLSQNGWPITLGSSLFMVALLGAIGGLMSIQRRIAGLPCQGDTFVDSVTMDDVRTAIWLAPVSGAAFGLLLLLLFASALLRGTIFPDFRLDGVVLVAQGVPGVELTKLFVWSFLAGFAERLVPDALDRLTEKSRQSQTRSAEPQSS